MNLPPSWQQLSSLGQSKLVKSSYFWLIAIPVVAKILEQVNPEAQLTIFGQVFHFNLTLPFSWKVFYFSSLFFAAGTIIYQLLCPKLIKEYPTYRDFVDAKQDYKYLIREVCKLFNYPKNFHPSDDPVDQHLVKLLLQYNKFTGRDGNLDLTEFISWKDRHLDPYYESYIMLFRDNYEDKFTQGKYRELRSFMFMMENLKLDENSESHCFWYLWNSLNLKNQLIRLVCSGCYTFAFTLLAFVLYQNIQSVWLA
jgi:hypothetical protein